MSTNGSQRGRGPGRYHRDYWREGRNGRTRNEGNDHDDTERSRNQYWRNGRNDRNNDNEDTERSRNNQHWRRNDNQRYRDNENDNEHTRRNNNQPRKPRPMGFKRLQELFENDNPEEILMILSNDRSGFKQLLNESKTSPDMIVLIVQILSTVCDCTFMNSKTAVLQSAIESQFGDSVIKFITMLVIQNKQDKRSNSFFWKNPDDFWNNIIKLSKHLHDTIPSSSSEWTLKLLTAVKVNIPSIETMHSIHIADDIKSQVNTLHGLVENTAKEVERKKETKPTHTPTDEQLEPLNDFRDLSVYPSVTEIITDQMPFLRQNLVKGSYQNVNHYLDIQYRLLREDFVMPLRKGICRYIKNPKDKLEDIKIYKGVRFLNAETINEQNCYRIQFDFSKTKKNFQYENSKRFMFGSLLCFTEAQNKFKSILFAKVAERKIQDLEKGQLIVGFSADIELPEYLYEIDFLLIESKVYFEPYYQVLNVLKNMQMENFPMERYIIEVRTDTRPPDYLLSIDPVFYKIEQETFWPLNWGERRFYGLNDAQSEAFRSALTREFAIVQGPPGTGKTFLGLKIAQTLLENKSAWYKKTPILVICFTNHALDQFLEGVLTSTQNVIRVGSQSKNPNLNNYNIRNRKKRMDLNPAVVQKRIEVRKYVEEIANINQVLNEIEKFDSVLSFQNFYGAIPDYYGSWFEYAPKEHIIDWLFEGSIQPAANRRAQPVEQPNTTEDDYTEIEDGEYNNDEVDDVFDNLTVQHLAPLTSIESLRGRIKVLEQQLNDLNNDPRLSYWEKERHRDDLRIELYKTEDKLAYLQVRLEDARTKETFAAPRFIDVNNPHNMLPEGRWQLYFYWLSLYQNHVRKRKETISLEFRNIYSVYRELSDIEDTEVMKDALVIGMTTTGAARLNASLQALKSPIVIVEEAAEVLEAHIISALTSHCQHLILIGDHQQLKPSAASFTIETKYKLNISLFQRMVDNDVQCHTLNIQHRMRPEIADLIRPTIYPILHDHESVFGRPSILGVERNLFFIDHREEEQMCTDNSKKNVHEAKFLIKFARHLILNGYKPENLIILAAYLGQMFEMQRERKIYKELLQDVRIAVLDNYQGEESDIVLLSLVRSNAENKIGFLKIENRVCVALSRARNGFYIMGNMEQLCRNSEIWPKIRETLERQDAIGTYLELRCQIHKHQLTRIKTAEDFSNLPEGGCDLLCDADLECGHVCKRLCHVDDRTHEQYRCKENCGKLLCENAAHVCKKMCYQVCGPCYYPVKRDLKCGHSATIECHLNPADHLCTELVETTLPCGHETGKPCFEDAATFKCPFPCDTRVEPCGHACTRTCHVRDDPDHLEYRCMKPCEKTRKGCTATEDLHLCTKRCFEECVECLIGVIKKRAKCGHIYKNVPCKTDVESLECRKSCKKTLPCGHHCKKKCDETCGDCQVEVEKLVPDCNHAIKIKCSQPPLRVMCKGTCPRLLPCGHVCGKKCNEECKTQCEEMVDCNIPSPCGHIIRRIMCYVRNTRDNEVLLSNCSERCRTELDCEHKCSGTCGECHQGRFHKRCVERCGVILVCNHECDIPCREACRPCQKPCQYRCRHNRCTKTCGDPCTICKEKCRRFCQHQECKGRCGDKCTVPPCSEPCKKKIKKCGHPCVGFCGDPCPKLCRICDEEELTEFFFGTEDEADARFVVLEDCGHVLEATGMDQWLTADEKAIKPKVCPKCNTVIKMTLRYAEYVKNNLDDLRKVKAQFYGNDEEIEEGRMNILRDADEIYASFGDFSWISEVIIKVRLRLERTKGRRRQQINKTDVAAIRAKMDLLKLTLDPIIKGRLSLGNYPESTKHIQWILKLIFGNVDTITKQESNDLVLEIDRLQRWLQFESITYQPYMRNESVRVKVQTIRDLLENRTQYIKSKDEEVKAQLEDLKKATASTIQLTDVERIEIVKAMGFKQGHWYKCPNGHPYVIANCGGAMEVSTCNECGAQIGGRNHALLPSNAVATEMDGARHGAWSEQANMGNYRF